jgi:hypothetical protein
MPVSVEKHMRIEQRAYALWQAEGRPDGRHEEHWRRAALEIEAEETARMAMSRKMAQVGRAAAKSDGRSPRRATKVWA